MLRRFEDIEVFVEGSFLLPHTVCVLLSFLVFLFYIVSHVRLSYVIKGLTYLLTYLLACLKPGLRLGFEQKSVGLIS